jgi:hypothetical protein
MDVEDRKIRFNDVFFKEWIKKNDLVKMVWHHLFSSQTEGLATIRAR